MNYLNYALAPLEDKALFDRIHDALVYFEAWAERLREKKIDVQHERAVFARLQDMEHVLIAQESAAAGGFTPDIHATLRAQRIYFRVLVLNLLNLEDAWQRDQDAKAAAKVGKV